MAATVTVRAKAFADARIVYLAQLLGCTWDEVFIRMIRLWSVCAELQTDQPEVRHIRACLKHPQAEQHLVESGLGDEVANPPSVVVRVRGCDETDWYYARLEQQAQIEAGRIRAAIAQRDAAGRFQSGAPPGSLQPDSSQTPASDLCPDLSDLIRPELPDPRTIVRAESEPLAPPSPPVAPGPARNHAERRARLVNDAWNYAALAHTQHKADGVDPHARNSWSGTNIAEPRKLLVAIVEDLAQGDAPNWPAIQDTIRNRIDVAAAEARRDKTLRWFTPMRMWDAKSFARCAELTPEQAAQPRGPNPPNQPPPAAPARRVRTL